MAQRLLSCWPMRVVAGIALGSSTLVGACVVPIPADVEGGDGGPSSPPVIVDSNPAMPFSNGAPIDVNLIADGKVTIDVKDFDLDDTLYVRVFRNYDPQTNPFDINDIEWAPGDGSLVGAVRQDIELSTALWCAGSEQGRFYVFDVVVSDRRFEDEGTPAGRATTGETAIRSWVGVCNPIE
jgi:hypothetical protein